MPKSAARRLPSCHECVTRRLCVAGYLTPEEIAELQPDIRQRSVRRGELLADEGQVATTVRVVKVGTVFGYRRGLDGRSRPIGVARRGYAFGLFGVFGHPNQATGRCLSAGRVCEMPVAALRGLGASNRTFFDSVTRTAVDSCGALATWSEAMRLPGVVNQLAYVMVLLSQATDTPVIELLPHTALAELLGTTRETIARSLATLEGEGGIRRLERKQCEIYRRNLLARVARAAR